MPRKSDRDIRRRVDVVSDGNAAQPLRFEYAGHKVAFERSIVLEAEREFGAESGATSIDV